MRRVRPTLAALARGNSGVAALELALAAPTLFMMLLGIIEIGRALWIQNDLSYSVAEAARCASVTPSTCGSASQTQAFAASRSGSGIAASVFTATSPSCGNQVSASYPMALSIPFMTLSVTLTAQACYPS